jgi:hypothetical protein
MVQKGKFRLFSFLVEQHLIYYKSLNKNNKLVAFSILKSNKLLKIIPLLNDFLLNHFLYYYSLQISIPNKRTKSIILALVDNNRSKIDKSFNLIFQRILKCDKSVKFLKNHKLERYFLRILSNKATIDLNSMEMKDSLILKHDEKLQVLRFYEINCSYIKNEKVTVHSLLKALSDFNQKGFLIFNIKALKNGNLVSNAYFVEIRSDKDNPSFEIENELNSLFHCEIIKKKIIRLNQLYCILWRSSFSEVFYNLDKNSDLFLSLSQFNFHNFSKFSVQFEKILELNIIEFHRLKPNLFFIEEKVLFLILEFYDPVEIKRILEKFFSKYFIFILILNMEEYNKLTKSNEISLMDNIKTLNSRDFTMFDLSTLKNGYMLKNS